MRGAVPPLPLRLRGMVLSFASQTTLPLPFHCEKQLWSPMDQAGDGETESTAFRRILYEKLYLTTY
jgi:hypothetical protein